MENWEDVRDLLGNVKQVQIQFIFEKKNIKGLKLIGDNNKEYYAKITKVPHNETIEVLKVKFQLPKVRKSRFPFQLPSLEVNNTIFEPRDES